MTNFDNGSEEIFRWYSFRAKNLYMLSRKAFRQFKYPIATNFAQESIEFAGKALLEMNNFDYAKDSHDFSRAFKQMFKKYQKDKKIITKIISISDKWLKQSRNISRYGIEGLSPEQLDEGKRTIANRVSNDAKYILDYLINKERLNKTIINVGILNGRVYGTSTDKHPLAEAQCNNIGRNVWVKTLKTEFQEIGFDVKVNEISISKIDSTINVVINPFGEFFLSGGNIPDIMEIIYDFISTGGTFITLGGLPFWAFHDVKTDIRKPYVIKELVRDGNRVKLYTPLKNTISWQMFNIITTGDTRTISGSNNSTYFQNDIDKKRFGDLERDININEYRGLRQETTNLIPIIRMNREDYGEIYPISLKKIDLGYLFLVSLDIQTNEELQLIIDAIKGYLHWLFK